MRTIQVILLLALLATALAGASWPGLHRDASRTGSASQGATFSIHPQVQWMQAIISSPVLYEGVIYASLIQGGTLGSLAAVSERTGAIIWVYSECAAAGQPVVSPGLGTVFCCETTKSVTAVSETGSLMWEFPVGACIHSPVVSGDGQRIYVLAQQAITALEPLNGTQLWTVANPGAGAQGWLLVEDGAGMLYAPSLSGEDGNVTVVRLDPFSNGAAAGSFSLPILDRPTSVAMSLVVDPGANVLYIGAAEIVLAVDLASGSMLWAYMNPSGGDVDQWPALSAPRNAETIYVAFDDGFLVAMDAANGTVLWELAATQSVSSPYPESMFSPIVDSSGMIYALDSGCHFYGIHPSGHVAWTFGSPDGACTYTGFEYPIIGSYGLMFTGLNTMYSLGATAVASVSPSVVPVGGTVVLSVAITTLPNEDASYISASCVLTSPNTTSPVDTLAVQSQATLDNGVAMCSGAVTVGAEGYVEVGVSLLYTDAVVASTTMQLRTLSLESLAPASGPTGSGTVLSLTGNGFAACQSAVNCSCQINGSTGAVVAADVINDTLITCEAAATTNPAGGAVPVAILVVAPTLGGSKYQGTTAAMNFTYIPPKKAFPWSIVLIGFIGLGLICAIFGFIWFMMHHNSGRDSYVEIDEHHGDE